MNSIVCCHRLINTPQICCNHKLKLKARRKWHSKLFSSQRDSMRRGAMAYPRWSKVCWCAQFQCRIHPDHIITISEIKSRKYIGQFRKRNHNNTQELHKFGKIQKFNNCVGRYSTRLQLCHFGQSAQHSAQLLHRLAQTVAQNVQNGKTVVFYRNIHWEFEAWPASFEESYYRTVQDR